MKKKVAVLLTAAVFAATITAGASVVQAASKSDDSWKKVEKAGTIKIGTEGTYAPFTYHDDDDNLTGYDVEVAKAVFDKLGIDVEFVECEWDSIIAGLDAGRFDGVFNQVTITDERAAKYAFADPYTYTTGALIVAKDDDDLNTFEGLKGKKVAASLTTAWADLAESYGATVSSTNQFSESVSLLESGRVDAILNDNAVFYDYVKETGDDGIKIAALSDDINTNAPIFRQDDKELTEKVNGALKELAKDGTLAKLSEEFLGADLSVDPTK